MGLGMKFGEPSTMASRVDFNALALFDEEGKDLADDFFVGGGWGEGRVLGKIALEIIQVPQDVKVLVFENGSASRLKIAGHGIGGGVSF